MFLGILAVGLLGLLFVGAVLAIVTALRLRGVESAQRELAARVERLERGAAPRAAEPRPERAPAVPPAEPPRREGVDPAPAAAAGPEEAVGAAAPGGVVAPVGEGRAARARSLDLESLIGGRWLNRVGIVAVLLAAAFFLKYAFDNDWVGPAGRVAIGLVAGTALMAGSQWFLGRGYRYFSEGIAALGGGVLFLSLWAAWDVYRLIPQPAAFGGMILVTAGLAGLALGRGSQRLAVLALGGGLATPGLLTTGVDRQATLFTYLAILVGCFLLLAWRRGWRAIAPAALVGVLIYAVGWYEQYYSPRKLERTLLFSTLLFAEFAAYLVARARWGRKLGGVELLLLPANAAWYGLGLHLMLYRDHRWGLTLAVLALGALHLAAARVVVDRERRLAPAVGLVLAGLALTFVTAAIPIRLEGEWITIAWALEGALLAWAGFRAGVRPLRLAALGLLVVVVGMLATQSGVAERLLLNERFASFAAATLALALAAFWARAHREALDREELVGFAAGGVAANVVAVWGLSEEVWRFLGRQQWNLDPRLARQMGLSLLWALAACLLIVLGVRWGSRLFRWQGLALLGATVVKVFLLDLSYLERAYRIASFLVLGVVLLAVSFWYQRSLAARVEADGGKEEP